MSEDKYPDELEGSDNSPVEMSMQAWSDYYSRHSDALDHPADWEE